MDHIAHWIEFNMGVGQSVQQSILWTLAVILTMGLIRQLVVRIVWRHTEDLQVRYYWQKGATYVTVLLTLLLVGRIWFAGIQSLATFLGLVTAGLAIALQDLVKSFAGWIFIMWRRPFAVGDRIQVGPYAGDVIDVRLFKFSLIEIGNWVDADQSTGRMIDIPNSMVLSEPFCNYTRGFEFIWDEIPVLVTFESDWKDAKKTLLDIVNTECTHLTEAAKKRVQEASKKYMIFYRTLTPTVYTSVRDCGVLLTMRYLTEPRKRRGTQQAIWERILDEFEQKPGIDFAYPTQRFFDHTLEGKPAMRPPSQNHPLPPPE